MLGIEKGTGSATESPYAGFARRMKPNEPSLLAVSSMAEISDHMLKKPEEKLHIKKLPSTTDLFRSSGYWHFSNYGVGAVLGDCPVLFIASLANMSLKRNKPSPRVGPVQQQCEKISIYQQEIVSLDLDKKQGALQIHLIEKKLTNQSNLHN